MLNSIYFDCLCKYKNDMSTRALNTIDLNTQEDLEYSIIQLIKEDLDKRFSAEDIDKIILDSLIDNPTRFISYYLSRNSSIIAIDQLESCLHFLGFDLELFMEHIDVVKVLDYGKEFQC